MLEEAEIGRMDNLVRSPQETVSPEAWSVMREQALVLVKSGFLPNTVNTPEKAISIVMKGRELGVPPMYALSNIAVINGKPTAGAELMLALIYRDHGDEAVRVVETTAERCTVAYKRRGWEEPELFTFSMEDAECAGLLGKDNWRRYPAAMLRARCISAVARLAFPDTIGGLYTPEELGARVRVAELGEGYEIEEVAPAEPEPPRRDRAARKTVTAPVTPRQRETLVKLARLVDEPLEHVEELDEQEAAELIGTLSQRYNALDPAERSRRSRALAGESRRRSA